MVLSGAAFGVLWGSVISLVGSIGGEWLGFELVRRYGRRASARIVGDDEIQRLERMFARHGAVAVVVTRALPVVMETMSVVAGLSTDDAADVPDRLAPRHGADRDRVCLRGRRLAPDRQPGARGRDPDCGGGLWMGDVSSAADRA